MGDDFQDWLDRVETAPDDADLRVVFADWCREHGLEPVAEWLRLEREHHQGTLEPGQRAAFASWAEKLGTPVQSRIARTPVEACRPPVPLSFECPQRWEAMQPLGEPGVRQCGECEQPVYWVESVEQAIEHARMGHCVAVAPSVARSVGDLDPPEAPRPVGPTTWPHDLQAPPGISVDRVPLLPPKPPKEPDPEPAPRSWWRRWFGSG